MRPGEAHTVFPPSGSERAQWEAVGDLLCSAPLDLVIDGQAVLLPPAVHIALRRLVEAGLAGCAVTCLPHPVDNPVDLRK